MVHDKVKTPLRGTLLLSVSLMVACFCCRARATTSPATSDAVATATVKAMVETLEELKRRLVRRETSLRKESEKMQYLFAEGVVSHITAEKARQNWEQAKTDLERIEKSLAEAESTVSSASDAAVVSVTIAPPSAIPSSPVHTDAADIAEDVQRTQLAIRQQQQELRAVLNSLEAARRQIAMVKAKLDAIIAETRSNRQHVHPLLVAADEYLNVPYRWGGTTSRGLDCSGLVYRALARIGIVVPHSAALLARRGSPLSVAQMQAGDLLFFANTYKSGISHVGIYLGGDRFIHASSGTGRVTIGTLRDPYFIRHFAGARRIVK